MRGIEFLILPVGDNLWAPLVSIAILEGIAVYAWRFRKEPGALPLLGIQLCKTGWLVAMIVGGLRATTSWSMFWLDIRICFPLLLALATFLLIAHLSGLEPRKRIAASHTYLTLTAFFVLSMLTNRWHGLFWALPADQHMLAMEILPGPIRRIELPVVYLMNLYTTGVCVVWVMSARGLRRRQAQMILLATVISWGGLIFAAAPQNTLLTTLPLSFCLSSMVTAWAFFRWRMLGLLPLAQETVVHSMIDGMMVLDQDLQIVTMNAVAQELFAAGQVSEGHQFSCAIAAWPELAALKDAPVTTELEADWRSATVTSTLQVTQTPLHTPAGHLLGRVLVFKNVTRERAQQARLMEQEKALSMFEERQRLGRELHDSGQIWFFLASQAQAIRSWVEQDNADRALQGIDRLLAVLRENSVGMRESITGLQTSLSPQKGFQAALEEQLDWYRRHCGLQATLLAHVVWNEAWIAPTRQAQLLRIVQEALSNIRKHAAAQRVQLTLAREGTTLLVQIEDDGCGFDLAMALHASGHFGLKMMQERAASIGAVFNVDSSPGSGSRLRVQIPCDERAPGL